MKIKDKKRIALLLTGQLRDFEVCANDIYEKVIIPLDVDLFIDCWAERGSAIIFRNIKSWLRKNKKISIDEILKFYSPKMLRIENYSEKLFYKIFGDLDQKLVYFHPEFKPTIPMIYKMNSCNQLVKEYEKINNFKYDYLIRMRPDGFINRKITISDLLKIKDGCITAQDHRHGPKGLLWDTFFFGKREDMLNICDVLPHFKSRLFKIEKLKNVKEKNDYALQSKGSLLLTQVASEKKIKIVNSDFIFEINDAKTGYLNIYGKIKIFLWSLVKNRFVK